MKVSTGHLSTNPFCPHCHGELDGYSTNQTDRSPQPNDFSICAYCGAVLVFTESLDLRVATLVELRELPLEVLVTIWQYKQMVQQIRMQMN